METDRLLVERVLAGDRDAFRDLVQRHRRLVAHVVFRMVPGREDAEELCQDTFVRAFRKLDSFHFESKLSTWIARIAYRLCLNHLERKGLPLVSSSDAFGEAGEAEPLLDRLPSGDPAALEEMESAETRAFVRAQVDALPVAYRTVVTLFHLEEMSVGEVAQVMELPAGTVKSHLFRARKLLKERMLERYSMEELRP